MLFNEIYGCYYKAVGEIIKRSVLRGEVSSKEMEKIINECAFSESIINIMSAIRQQRWQLIDDKGRTPIKNVPEMPLTEIEKRWLKSISMDARIKLFDVDMSVLDNVKPLFTPDDYVIYDKYSDGDDYENAEYIKIFRSILKGIREKRKLHIVYRSGKHKEIINLYCIPICLEYSEKDDKFRLLAQVGRNKHILNLSNIVICECADRFFKGCKPNAKVKTGYFVAEIKDERSAMERAMLHFSHFEKEAERLGRDRYKIRVKYHKEDETELVIRVLSFGPLIKVTEPENFVNLIRERLLKQKSCGLK